MRVSLTSGSCASFKNSRNVSKAKYCHLARVSVSSRCSNSKFDFFAHHISTKFTYVVDTENRLSGIRVDCKVNMYAAL